MGEGSTGDETGKSVHGPNRRLGLASHPGHLVRIVRFAAVSGTGLLLDLAIFLALVGQGYPPFGSSVLSSGAAVAFVYFVSVRRIFRYEGRFILPMFLAYAAYQAAGIVVGSAAVQALVDAGLLPLLAKLAILPVTFGANYLFMHWLTGAGARARSRAAPQ